MAIILAKCSVNYVFDLDFTLYRQRVKSPSDPQSSVARLHHTDINIIHCMNQVVGCTLIHWVGIVTVLTSLWVDCIITLH